MMFDSQIYTVGWICAVETELVAAQELLDEEHAMFDVPVNDNNSYTLGRIGRHNVAIAALPICQYGIVNSANVARDMVRSFPNIRIGLMVGIGGGVPTRHDIRLGDVVVGSPGYGNGGIYQYDYGIAMQRQGFTVTGTLNQPPMFALTAMATLKARYARRGHNLEKTVRLVLENNRRLLRKYQRPHAYTDRLFASGYAHRLGDKSCAESCDTSRLNIRNPRPDDQDNVEIHYGHIASANTLMKDASIRDDLSAREDILCFEMEAAGLNNHFPCVVIRGICDYSDSHKNDEWQGYAAMMAAAYAKDLLLCIQPNQVEVAQAIRNIEGILTRVEDCINKNARDASEMKFRLDKQIEERILEWITPYDHAVQLRNALQKWQPGTGQWFLDSEEFQAWVKERNQTLFCPGIPGAGKTTLTGIVVAHLQSKYKHDRNAGIAYVFFNFRECSDQDAGDMIASILRQLVEQQPSVHDDVKSRYDNHNRFRTTRSSFEDVLKSLFVVASSYTRLFIIVDALDECTTPEVNQSSGANRAQFLEEIFTLQKSCGANIFATSRPLREIIDNFQNAISLHIRARNEDVQKYLDGNKHRLPSFVQENKILWKSIQLAITKAADGMFLLADIHLAAVRGRTSIGNVQDDLARFQQQIGVSIETRLTASYDAAMERIKSQPSDFRALAEGVLAWTVCAKRPMSVLELQHALVMKTGRSDFDTRFLPQIDLTDICAGLVAMDDQGGSIRLVHYTTQQYFEQAQRTGSAEIELARHCIGYLSSDVFALGVCANKGEFYRRLKSYPLYNYAATHWGDHARAALKAVKARMTSPETEEAIRELEISMVLFLKRTNNAEASSQPIMNRHYDMLVSQGLSWPDISGTKRAFGCDTPSNLPHKMLSLHLAAYFGLDHAMKALLSNGQSADSIDTFGRTPLWWASYNGHENAVTLLLLETAFIDARDPKSGLTPLLCATLKGYDSVVRLLLDRDGVSLNSMDKGGRTPLSHAAEKGYGTIVKLLMAHEGVELDANSKDGRTPLSYAAEQGHVTAVKLLIDRDGVSLDARDHEGRTPLSLAAYGGHEIVVRLLAAKEGVDLNARDHSGFTPLILSVWGGHDIAVRTLVNLEGVDLNAKCNDGCTALSHAALGRQNTIMKLQIGEEGINLKGKNRDGNIAFAMKLKGGMEGAVKVVIGQELVDLECTDNHGRALLPSVVYGNCENMISLLLQKDGVDPNAKDNQGRTPLSHAARGGHETLVSLLLNKIGVDLNAKDIHGLTPLSYAVRRSDDRVVRLLLDQEGIDLNTKDDKGRTPLLYAVQKGHWGVVKLLVEKEGVDLNSTDRNGRTPLMYLAASGHEPAVRLFIDRQGVNPDARDCFGRTPLSYASGRGHEAVVRLLMENLSGDPGAKDVDN